MLELAGQAASRVLRSGRNVFGQQRTPLTPADTLFTLKLIAAQKYAQGFLPHLGVCASGPALCYIEAFAVKPWA